MRSLSLVSVIFFCIPAWAQPVIGGAGYTSPVPVSVAPGQVITLFVQGADNPLNAGISVNYRQGTDRPANTGVGSEIRCRLVSELILHELKSVIDGSVEQHTLGKDGIPLVAHAKHAVKVSSLQVEALPDQILLPNQIAGEQAGADH